MTNFKEIDETRRLLGLVEPATLKEIKSAYRRTAHRYHPDKHSSTAGGGTEETVKRLSAACKLLMDYCSNHKYSFREGNIARTYLYEECLRKYY